VNLFHTPGDEPYATVSVSGHRETHGVRRRGFKGWLLREYYRKHGDAPVTESVERVIRLLEAQARFDGECEEVFVRVGENNGRIYIDLGDPDWRAVEIDAEGWRIIDRVPVRFRRPSGLLALPVPVSGGTIDEWRPLLNFSDDADWVLFVGSLISSLRPCGPYFVTEIGGEQGTGKTTAARMFRALIDPSRASVRSKPRDERDLMIAASNGWIVAFDNLSSLWPWLSDALCRLSTGGGFSTRQLFTDDDEMIFDAQRPSVLTSIENVWCAETFSTARSVFSFSPSRRIPDAPKKTCGERSRRRTLAYSGHCTTQSARPWIAFLMSPSTNCRAWLMRCHGSRPQNRRSAGSVEHSRPCTSGTAHD
jgi:hypothetical protein